MPFAAKDTVLSFDCGKLYEAKVMKVLDMGGERKYFIHYNGWARKYDCWLDEEQLVAKGDVKAIEKLKELAKDKCLPTAKRGKKVQQQSVLKIGKHVIDIENLSRGKTTAAGPKASVGVSEAKLEEIEDKLKKANSLMRGIDVISFDVKTYQRDLLVQDLIDQIDDDTLMDKIKMTIAQKKHLLDEWNLITKDYNLRLIQLPKPRNLTVDAILTGFLQAKREELTANCDGKDEDTNYTIDDYEFLFHGLRIQLSRAIPTLLLYRQERAQYAALMANEIAKNYPLSSIYGAEHLIRFLVRMPKQLSGVVLQKEALGSIFDSINQLLGFLETNHSEHFSVANYISTPEAMDYAIQYTSETDLHVKAEASVTPSNAAKRNKRKRTIDDV